MLNEQSDINATQGHFDDEPGEIQPDMTLSKKYRLIKQIGVGAMGVVWQAHDDVGDRMVALKFVPKEFEKLERFDKELERMRKSFSKIHKLNHESICPILGLEKDEEFGYFLVMQFLEGETLDDFKYKYRQERKGKDKGLPLDEVLGIIKPIARALDYAHHKDVIHRDIKPANIFLSKTSKGVEIQIIDFGLADEIREGLSQGNLSSQKFDKSGSPPYKAPEQWQGHLQTAATDQYALAVIAYELLAGHLPFSGDEIMIMNAVLRSAPEPIRGIPESANDALLQALSKNREDRFATCQEFIEALVGKKATPEIETLLKRGHQFLEDSDWQQAAQLFDRILDITPEYAPAYTGLLCTELQVRNEELLGDYENPISDIRNFQKAVRFADIEYKAVLESYAEKIRERFQQEQERKYRRLAEETKTASTEDDWRQLVMQFQEMGGYRNTAILAEQCEDRCRKLKKRREEQERIEQERHDEEERHERIEREIREKVERTRKEKERIEREHSAVKDLYHSTGMRFLEERQYDEALNAFEMAMENNSDNAETFYYAAICRLQGKKAFSAQRHEIEAIEKDIIQAIKIADRKGDSKGIYLYFRAYIKYDYFERKSFNTSPTYRELLEQAIDAGISSHEVNQLFSILGVSRPEAL